jgi:uncharacterized damage-inducible protein DinB
MSETARLADQLRRAFVGPAWHGDPLLEILAGVSAETAAARPIVNAHGIWELVLHIAAWDDVVLRRTGGATVTLADAENFPAIPNASENAWRGALTAAQKTHEDLVKIVAAFPDSRLEEQVPGKTENYYTFYYMLSGITQHELYHAGQIALLKKFRTLS